MMLLLVLDVTNQRIGLGFADGKRASTVLPFRRGPVSRMMDAFCKPAAKRSVQKDLSIMAVRLHY